MSRRVAAIALVTALILTGTAAPAAAIGSSRIGVVPLVVDDSRLAACGLLIDPASGTQCALWFEGGDESESDFDFANLELWNVASEEGCHSTGHTTMSEWILSGYDARLAVTADPTFVCIDMGHYSLLWQDLAERVGSVGTFSRSELHASLARRP